MRLPKIIAVTGALHLVACGAASNQGSTTPDVAACSRAQQTAGARWAEVEAEAERLANPAGEAVETPATRALAALEEHVVSLRETPRELSGEDAMGLSNTMMDGIDALGTALPDAERERADDAAEALLTDRSRDGSRRSATGALSAFEAAVAAAQPQSLVERARRGTAQELRRRAHQAVEGYEVGVAEGDRAADRAEAAPLPEEGLSLTALRDAATLASREARSTCGVPRTLAAPGL